ncbi:hypothetical protein LCGC14_0718640 [marine sediment metagenome]|uniref:Uncharacterized protein n=1 Tax=marine sediment metagenome TaxID=412755 RepID=A0A0F9QHC4_9ZZZZ
MAKKANVINWPIESIPNVDDIYYRIHKMYIEEVTHLIPSSGFRTRGDSMSTDWNKYSVPEKLRLRAKIPEDNRIVEMNVGNVRTIPLTVKHAPDHIVMNRAHTDVLGLIGLPKSELNKIRTQLATLSEWVI